MIALARRAACVSLAVLLLASPAFALVPSPTRSSVDPVVVAIATLFLPFHVVVRDAAGTPIPGSNVSLHFAPPVHPYNAQNPPFVVTCPNVSVNTDATGSAVFSGIRFGGFTTTATVGVFADGIFLRSVTPRSPDFNDDGDVDLVDFAAFRDAYLNHPTTTPQGDFDNSGTVDVADLSAFRGAFVNNAHGTNCP